MVTAFDDSHEVGELKVDEVRLTLCSLLQYLALSIIETLRPCCPPT